MILQIHTQHNWREQEWHLPVSIILMPHMLPTCLCLVLSYLSFSFIDSIHLQISCFFHCSLLINVPFLLLRFNFPGYFNGFGQLLLSLLDNISPGLGTGIVVVIWKITLTLFELRYNLRKFTSQIIAKSYFISQLHLPNILSRLDYNFRNPKYMSKFTIAVVWFQTIITEARKPSELHFPIWWYDVAEYTINSMKGAHSFYLRDYIVL